MSRIARAARPSAAGSSGLPPPGKRKGKKPAEPPPDQPKKTEFDIPAFSRFNSETREPQIDWEDLRKKNIRRQAPQGEDLKGIKKVLLVIKKKAVDVHEFVELVSPYTGDNGAHLREIFEEDVASFRKLARKIYETITQDVSDVLINEQLQIAQYFEEKHTHFSDKMMQCINEIFDMIPSFEFEKFHEDGVHYLKKVLPIPEDIQRDEEDIDMQHRQAAYHRLQWLRTEGERLNEENTKLSQRLQELKKQQKHETQKAYEIAEAAESERQDLMVKETEIKETLEELNESIEKAVIEKEAAICKEANREAKASKPPAAAIEAAVKAGTATGAVKKKSTEIIRKRSGAALRKKRADWVAAAAAEVETTGVEEKVAGEVSKTSSKLNVKKPRRRPKTPPRKQPTSPFHYSPDKTPPDFRQPIPEKPRSPFHFSPIKTPPDFRGPEKPKSPFHYSPIKTPPNFGRAPVEKPRSPFHYSPPRTPPGSQGAFGGGPRQTVQETRIEEKATSITQKRMPDPRKRLAPRDSWGGF